MKKIFEKSFISLTIIIVMALILIGAGLTFYNKKVMENALHIKSQSAFTNSNSEKLLNIIRQMDVSARGYALIKEESFLFYKLETVRNDTREVFANFDSIFTIQNYQGLQVYDSVRSGMNTYVDLYALMVEHLRADRKDEYIRMLKEDYGARFWPTYNKFAISLNAFEHERTLKADAEYQAASARNIFVQVLILIIGFPTLIFLMIRLKRQEARRSALLRKLDNNNKKFLFNHGESEETDSEQVMETSIKDLKKASDFVTQISSGNYHVQWSDLNENNSALNKENLVGRLIQMREQMKKVKQEDEKRLWVTEGLSKFSDIIRNYQDNLSELANQAAIFLVKYLDSQQGAIFVPKEGQEGNPYLEMIACYAFDRKKYIDKKIYIGDGVVGQIFLEGNTTMLTQLPQGYTSITSGLGHATPSCLLVVPLKFNDKVRAIFEVASFHKFSPAEIGFIEKAGEFIASAITSAENNETTHRLLNEFKTQAEQLRAQEEELRQNMEELEATQEEMKRKERELEDRLREHVLK